MKRKVAALVLGACLLPLLAGCSALTSIGAPRPTPSPTMLASSPVPRIGSVASDEAVCGEAQDLTDAGQPGDALDLIAQYRKSLPKSADRAPAQSCEPERLSALVASGETKLSEAELGATKTEAQTFGSTWDQLVSSWVKPTQGALFVAFVIALVLLVLARLGVYFQYWRTPAFVRHSAARLGVGFVASAGMLAGSLVTTWAPRRVGALLRLRLFSWLPAPDRAALGGHGEPAADPDRRGR
ncbi:MAG: hypothetical protein WDM88_11655 [Galbitalea sp.]